jgi:hypothetical protein
MRWNAGKIRGERAAAVCALLAVLFSGCASPVDPPLPPSGGQEYLLDFQDFQQTVAPLLSRHGCDAEGDCHGGGIRGTFALSPVAEKDPAFDFEQAALQVDGTNPTASPLLTKPLALEAGGVPHSFKAFDSTGDEDYLLLRQWIEAGEYR